jgi:hypothetical protein
MREGIRLVSLSFGGGGCQFGVVTNELRIYSENKSGPKPAKKRELAGSIHGQDTDIALIVIDVSLNDLGFEGYTNNDRRLGQIEACTAFIAVSQERAVYQTEPINLRSN